MQPAAYLYGFILSRVNALLYVNRLDIICNEKKTNNPGNDISFAGLNNYEAAPPRNSYEKVMAKIALAGAGAKESKMTIFTRQYWQVAAVIFTAGTFFICYRVSHPGKIMDKYKQPANFKSMQQPQPVKDDSSVTSSNFHSK